jgi:malate permease and related proteins
MTELALLCLCLGLGLLLRAAGRLPADTPRALNAVLIQVALPALAFRTAHRLDLSPGLAAAALAPWAVFAVAVPAFLVLGRAAGWPRERVGALALTAGLPSGTFVGLPMIEALYGRPMLGVGIIGAQLGAGAANDTAGTLLAARLGGGCRASVAALLRRLALFPPLVALVLGSALRPLPVPEVAGAVLDRLSALVGPLALLSIGCQLGIGDARGLLKPLAAGLAFRLILAPALTALFVVHGLGVGGVEARVIVSHAAAGPQVAGAILAREFGLDARLASLLVGVGTALGLATMMAWHWFVLFPS